MDDRLELIGFVLQMSKLSGEIKIVENLIHKVSCKSDHPQICYCSILGKSRFFRKIACKMI